jgi:hypothetical protein
MVNEAARPPGQEHLATGESRRPRDARRPGGASSVGRAARAVLLLGALLSLAACEGVGTTPRSVDVEVVATDVRSIPGRALQAPADDEPTVPTTPTLVDGTVEALATIQLMGRDGQLLPAQPATAAFAVVIGADQPVRIARFSVPEGGFDAVRLRFESVRAHATSGLGGPAIGTIHVLLGGEPLTVERPVEVVVGRMRIVTIELDMNASEWVPFAEDDSVHRDRFEKAVRLRVR